MDRQRNREPQGPKIWGYGSTRKQAWQTSRIKVGGVFWQHGLLWTSMARRFATRRPCVSKQCPADGVWRIGHGLPSQRALLDTVYPLREHLNGVQRMVSGGYCEGLFPDTVCWTRLRNTWEGAIRANQFAKKKASFITCERFSRVASNLRFAILGKCEMTPHSRVRQDDPSLNSGL